ncbi:flagellar hook-associated protein FlgL [Clostridium estertheticum]|uniref:flagellar hook-associated protein FlgL n=1 Tax=Clostridium estertheticum TaxID=238834 RepID=UPI00124C88D2|nr:flagellar hook-associated protein FlgL [Clostridium estertheticum]MBU3170221.1 flagellar hook-associated protein FlgL [Clostridium estertheticum]MBZ9616999.1 flagellar hook-associated protein FlgL [Clostridium estertheticum subsp. laramiense]WAG72701.1 flagellar hook-associated protein FlgL [Clostridium estertheticum]
MRVTNKMLSNNFLRDMRTNLTNLSKIQSQMDTGKQITKASDDPLKTSRIMQMYSDIDANKQYNSNIKNTTNWLDTTDTALGQVGNVCGRIEDLLVSAGNAGYSSDQKQAIKDEINQKIQEVSQILNTSFDGKYIFGGTRATTKPTETKSTVGANGPNSQLVYSKIGGGELVLPNPLNPTATDDSTVQYNQINSKLLVEVSQGVTMDYNITASQIINYGTGTGAKNLMGLLGDITEHLDSTNANDIKELNNADLDGIQKAMTNVLKLRSEVGAKQNRMESAQTRNEDQNFNMTEILSSTEDIDITEKTMEYATMQTVYTASLQTSAKVIQPSLLDYLR